ncbi:MAG: hypothetical protein ACK55I_34205, partial [bacterium]
MPSERRRKPSVAWRAKRGFLRVSEGQDAREPTADKMAWAAPSGAPARARRLADHGTPVSNTDPRIVRSQPPQEPSTMAKKSIA